MSITQPSAHDEPDFLRGSAQECQRAEATSDRLDTIRAAINCLNVAEECCQEEGILLTGTLKEMVEQLNLVMRQVEDDWLEEG